MERKGGYVLNRLIFRRSIQNFCCYINLRQRREEENFTKCQQRGNAARYIPRAKGQCTALQRSETWDEKATLRQVDRIQTNPKCIKWRQGITQEV
jgi:hypothetical protein